MHGRLKVRNTAEQQEAKRKEREKKLKIYTGATQRVFEKRSNNEFDEEALKITGEILSVNPDFYSLWNYRKEIIQDFVNKKPKELLEKMFTEELFFLETCLNVNPKSYGTWHHRCFVLSTMPMPNWKRELDLCNKFLEYDERNFHCWDYRRFVVKSSAISLSEEFKFTTDKIASNFSNYSSWHYRSKLLPVLFPDKSHPFGVKDDILCGEYENVQNAIFTDPYDQSAWFYHCWLLGRGDIPVDIMSMHISRTNNSITLVFTKPILPCENQVIVEVNNQIAKTKLLNHKQEYKESVMWICDEINFPDGNVDVRVSLCNNQLSHSTNLSSQSLQTIYSSAAKETYKFRNELSLATNDTLQKELEAISELYEIEPDNKWVILTIVFIMKSLDSTKYETRILDYIDILKKMDPKRKNYYQDLKSKVVIENRLHGQSLDNQSVVLSNLGLSVLYHTEFLSLTSHIDLHGNLLTNVKNFEFLKCVKKLTLDFNHIDNLCGLNHLPQLETLSLKGNTLKEIRSLEPLKSCKKLKYLDIQGNPICSKDESMVDVKNMLPNIIVKC